VSLIRLRNPGEVGFNTQRGVATPKDTRLATAQKVIFWLRLKSNITNWRSSTSCARAPSV
jgi:hypothetical protein